ncbi:MAG: Fe-S cluster assembly ATPase SufC [Parcubacteria group bacterium]
MSMSGAVKNVLSIKNLAVTCQGKEILKSLSLQVLPGQLHVIAGPNGSGKSTLAHVLAGDPRYVITQGSIFYGKIDLLALAPEERARVGLFVAFQHPVEIPGLSVASFLHAVLGEQARAQGFEPQSPNTFLVLLKKKLAVVGLPANMLERPINVGFSGGEKKRLELLQLLLLEPSLIILDELDSGVDSQGTELIIRVLQKLRAPARTILVITHNPALLKKIKPDAVHHLATGQLVEARA